MIVTYNFIPLSVLLNKSVFNRNTSNVKRSMHLNMMSYKHVIYFA